MKKFLFSLLCAVLLLGSFFLLSSDAQAASDIAKQAEAFVGERGADLGPATDIRFTIALGIRVGLGFLGMLFTVYTIYAGFLMMTSAGNQTQYEKGRNSIKYAVIGLVIIFTSYGLTTFVVDLISGESEVDCFFDSERGGWYTYTIIDIQEDQRRFYNDDPLFTDSEFQVDPCPHDPGQIQNRPN